MSKPIRNMVIPFTMEYIELETPENILKIRIGKGHSSFPDSTILNFIEFSYNRVKERMALLAERTIRDGKD